MRSILPAALAVALLAAPASAQIGHTPENSPYRDLEFRQEMTLYSGYYSPSKDPAGVAPQSGPLVGLRYDIRVGGPAYLTARVARVFSERTILDPTKIPGQRTVGTESWPLYLSDVGISLNLTGPKSLHRLVPVLNGGLGIASDFRKADKGGYQVGTQFALTFGGGVKWVPSGRLQLRADVSDHLFQIQYPTSYTASQVTGADNVWKHNATFTLGASYLFFR
ncbi:MAG: hypothetical protein ACJ79S_15500 [Gemmatimonadaceae bacterium]